MTRLKMFSDRFTQCSKCNFEYMAFSKKYESSCPKCNAEIETDEDYLASETKSIEEVNCDEFFTQPTYRDIFGGE